MKKNTTLKLNIFGTLIFGCLGFIHPGIVFAQESMVSSSFYTMKFDDTRAVYLDKKDFQVYADGKGDDSFALQQAINKVEEQSKNGVVYIPEGTYRIGKAVNIWKGIRLIGYGKRRPLFILAANSPGFQEGREKYMFRFCDRRTSDGTPSEGTPGTLFSGLSNVDIKILEGNPAAIAVRFHVAQHSFLEHINFDIGSALSAIEEMGSEIVDCQFSGGESAIKTGLTSAGWQSLIMDCTFNRQRKLTIESKDAGLTVIRCRFKDTPNAINVLPGNNEKMFIKDSWFENISNSAINIGNYFDPKTQVSMEGLKFFNVPISVSFAFLAGVIAPIPKDSLQLKADGPMYTVSAFSHGLHLLNSNQEVIRKFTTSRQHHVITAMGQFPEKDIPAFPDQDKWVNIMDLGAKGDGKTDDTKIFIEAIKKHSALFIPIGNYLVSQTLVLQPQTTLIGMHPTLTKFVLKDLTAGFADTTSPKPLMLTPKGGHNIISGIGFDLGQNPGVIGIKWLAAADSYLNDVHFPSSRSKIKGKGQYYSIWVTDGGGGIFKDSWLPSEFARCSFFVSETQTPGKTYMLSVEHHKDVEVKLSKVKNWTFYALQTEEDTGSEDAFAVTIDNCENINFVNLFCYRRAVLPRPFISAVRISQSANIVFRGMHNFSSGPFPYDNAILLTDSGAVVRQHEFANFSIR